MWCDVAYKGHMIHSAVVVDVDGDAHVMPFTGGGACGFLDGSYSVFVGPATTSHACPLHNRAPIIGIGKSADAPTFAAVG